MLKCKEQKTWIEFLALVVKGCLIWAHYSTCWDCFITSEIVKTIPVYIKDSCKPQMRSLWKNDWHSVCYTSITVLIKYCCLSFSRVGLPRWWSFLTGMRGSLRVKILSCSSLYLPESSPRLLTWTEMPSKWIKPFKEARLQKGPPITACVQLLHCGPRSPHHNCPSRLIAVMLCWCLSSCSTVNSYPLWAPDPCFFCLRLWRWAGTEEIFVEWIRG